MNLGNKAAIFEQMQLIRMGITMINLNKCRRYQFLYKLKKS